VAEGLTASVTGNRRFAGFPKDRAVALASLPKGQTEKLVLAWSLHGRTTVGGFLTERSLVSSESRVPLLFNLQPGR
jgi:hypothetical protein